MVLRLQDKMNASLYAMLTEDTDGNVYRIDKLANRMGFNRQLSSAVAIASPLGDSKTRDTRRPCRQLIKAITAMDENIDRVMNHSGRSGRSEMTSTAALCAEAVPWNLNDEKDDRNGENPSPILATSDSNIAVDNLVEGCANVGLRVVRLGRPEAIRPELLRHCIDRPSDNKGNGGGWSNY